MKVSLIKTNKKNKKTLSLSTTDALIKSISCLDNEDIIEQLRSFVSYSLPDTEFPKMHLMYKAYPSVVMKKDSDGSLTPQAYNGLLTLTAGPVRNSEEADEVKRMAAILPPTVAAFLSSSGRSVKIITAIKRSNGQLPTTEEEAERLLQQAVPLICPMYAAVLQQASTDATLNVSPAVKENDKSLLHNGFRMTFDPEPLYRPNATPLDIPDRQPSNMQLSQQRATLTEEQSKKGKAVAMMTQQLIDMLNQRYTFRMNKVMGYVEYYENGHNYYGWQPVDERVLNTMAMEARLAGINVRDKDVRRYLVSNMIRTYDPIDEYLWNVGDKWDGKDHIGRLAKCVPNNNPMWQQWFRTWFLGMVAQWRGRNPRYGNSIVPLLISKQGYNKSTFCKLLLPPELQWGYNDSLVLAEKKSVLQAMASFLLINLDEFNQISPKVQQGFLKNIIQLASVKVKPPYGKHVEDFRRLASFIATSNITDLLADPTGNRRFLGIELTGPIDLSQRINYTQLYAQAMALLDQGEPYWFSEEQTKQVIESNRRFQQRTPEELFFYECFAIPDSEADGEYLTATAIYQRIHQHAGSSLRYGNVANFSRVLTNIDGLRRRRTKRGTEYLVKCIH